MDTLPPPQASYLQGRGFFGIDCRLTPQGYRIGILAIDPAIARPGPVLVTTPDGQLFRLEVTPNHSTGANAIVPLWQEDHNQQEHQ